MSRMFTGRRPAASVVVRSGLVALVASVALAGWSFYIFNIADAAITLGVLCLFADVFLGSRAAKPAPRKRVR